VRAWRVAEANAIIAAARGERILSKPRRLISETSSPCSPGNPALPSRSGRVRANVRVQGGISEAVGALY
jgi:hypothetical protein